MSLRSIILGTGLVLCTCMSPTVIAHRNGITTTSFGVDGCNECHSGGTDPAVEVVGPEFVRPLSTHEFTVRIRATGDQTRGGFNASATDGNLSTGGKNASKTRLAPAPNGVEITHQERKDAKNGVISFSFRWTAPEAFSSVDLNVWGNAVNGDGGENGDRAANVVHKVNRGEFGLCPSTPQSCAVAAKTGLVIKDSDDDAKDSLSFSWKKGHPVSVAEFGNPTADTDYYLCLYKDGALIAELDVPGGTRCGGGPCWKATGDPAAPNAIVYKDKVGAPSGVRSVKLTPGNKGEARLTLKAKGKDLPDPVLGLPVLGSSVTAELHNTSSAACFGDTYSGGELRKDDGHELRAVGSNP